MKYWKSEENKTNILLDERDLRNMQVKARVVRSDLLKQASMMKCMAEWTRSIFRILPIYSLLDIR